MIRNFVRNLLAGRYGPDHLNIAMVVLSLVMNLLNVLFKFSVFIYLSWTLIVLALLRMLSRKIEKRRAENDVFIRYWWPVRSEFLRLGANIKHRKTHKFIKCPSCSNTLRLPKGQGKLQVTCPKCGERFIRKS